MCPSDGLLSDLRVTTSRTHAPRTTHSPGPGLEASSREHECQVVVPMTTHKPRWDSRVQGSAFISHWTMTDADLARLVGLRRLTLWNVRFPSDFRFAQLSDLELLDIRGGSRDE